MKWAIKCSAARVNGVWRDVYKEPKTDTGKNSKRGKFKVVRDIIHSNCQPIGYITVGEDDPRENILKLVFENGKIMSTTTLAKIRERAKL
jgi:nicotinamide phosphoribosyltransferase